MSVKVILTVVLTCVALMINDVEHLLCTYWPSVCLWKNVCLYPLLIFNQIVFLVFFLSFLLLSCMSSLYILDINPLSDYYLQIFSPIP